MDGATGISTDKYTTTTTTLYPQLTIPEASNSVHGRHFYDECEHVIDEGVEGLVGEHSPWEMGHGLQLIVDEQLWSHCDET